MQPVGVIDFQHGVLKTFQADSKTWQDIPSTVPRSLLEENLGWNYRVCAEGHGKVYILNTRGMVLHCLDVASRRWAETRRVDTSYRARWAAMTYSKGMLYVSGGKSIGGKERYRTMVSIPVDGGAKSSVPANQQPDMLYSRTSHGMAGQGERILVCGGVGESSFLANCEVFDLGIGTWVSLTDMQEARYSFGLVPTATAVFVLGGITRYEPRDVSPTLSDTVSVFDWQTQQWTALPRLPKPLCAIQAVYRGGSLWLLGAVTGECKDENNPSIVFTTCLECVMEHDVTQQRWVTHDSTPGIGINGVKAYIFPM